MPNSKPTTEDSAESVVTGSDASAQDVKDETRALERALADLRRHHATGVEALREREKNLRNAAKALEKTQSAYQALLHDHEQLLASHSATQAELKALGSRRTELGKQILTLEADHATHEREIAETTGRLEKLHAEEQEVRSHIADSHAEHEKHKTAAESELLRLQGEQHAIFQEAEERYRDLQQITASISAAEGKLFTAQGRLQQAETDRETVTTETAALITQRSAQEGEIHALDIRLQSLRAEELAARKSLQSEQESLRSFAAETAEKKAALNAEVEALRARLAEMQGALVSASDTLQETRAEHDKLQQQNRILAEAEQKLDEVKNSISQSEALALQTRENNTKLQKAGEALQSALSQLKQDEKAAMQRADLLHQEEALLQKTLKELQASCEAEQLRFEAEQQKNSEAELAATARLAGIEARHERQQRESVQLEARLYSLQTMENDLDKRYARLALLHEGSPESMEQWKAIQELKKTIADALPDKEIQVRPETRVQVVPRKK